MSTGRAAAALLAGVLLTVACSSPGGDENSDSSQNPAVTPLVEIQLEQQESGTDVLLQAVSAVDEKVV